MAGQLYTLAQAQLLLAQQLADKLDEGTHCPTCEQWAKRYRRPLTSAMAYALVIVAQEQQRLAQRRSPAQYVHVENMLKNYPGIPSSLRGDFAKLQHWDLIAPAWGMRDDGSKRNGYYKVTAAGYDFIHGRIAVPSHVILYNGKRGGHTGEHVTIKDVLRKQFDYNEIMHDYKLPAEPNPKPQPQSLFDTEALTVKPPRNMG